MNLVQKLKEEAKDLTVLYVEDEEICRENMLLSLSRLFYKVLLAKDGQEAISLLNEKDVDLIITDIEMPNMTGIELVKEIRKDKDGASVVPIIVVTAHNEQRYLSELIHFHIESFLHKPVEKQDMIEALYKVCSSIQNKKSLEQDKKKLF